MNKDGIVDIVVSNGYQDFGAQDCTYIGPGNNINIFYGKGDGTFQELKRVSTGAATTSLAVADFDRSGTMDIAYASGNQTANIAITYQNADTSFYGVQSISSCAVEESVQIADFNNDGNLDIATTSRSAGLAGLFLGLGDGNVTGPTTFSVPGDIFWSAHGDFDGDGNMDLAIAAVSDPCINILMGSGDGNFAQTTFTYAQKGTDVYQNFFVGDINADGLDDLFTATPPYINIHLASKTSPPFVTHTFSAPPAVSDCGAGQVADLNNDGLPDVVIACDGGLVSMIGDGTGTNFQVSLNANLITKGGIDLGDLNEDGYVDAVSGGVTSVDLQYFLNDKTGNLVLAGTLQMTDTANPHMRIVDLDGDGHGDIIANTGVLTFTWLGRGDGSFAAPRIYPSGWTYTFDVGDLNKDGKVDLIVPAADAGLQIYMNRGCGP
jgi:hypothetical protein